MNVKEGLFYTKEHEWVRIEGDKAVIGITDHAQSALGDITYVGLPKPGEEFEQFKQIATVESVKAASDVYAPVSGKVEKINDSLEDAPETVNVSPYDKGWFAEMKVSDPGQTANLMTADKYKEYLEGLD